jgi:hypothetical protein
MKKQRSKSDGKTSVIKLGRRTRDSVLRDFEKAAGPLRGQNRDQKPKA